MDSAATQTQRNQSTQLKPSKLKRGLLLASAILLLLVTITLPVAALMSMFNDTADPSITAMVYGVFSLFALFLVAHGAIGLFAVTRYRKVAKLYKTAMYMYVVAIISIPLLLLIVGITFLLGSVVLPTGTMVDGDSIRGQLAGFLGSLPYLLAQGIFFFSIACAVVSIILTNKK